MAALGDLLIRVGANIDGFEKSMGDVSKRLNAIDREAQKAFSGFDKVGQRLSDIGSTLSLGLTAPLVGLSAAAVTAFGTLDSLERGLTVVTGSAEKTAIQLKELREVAKLPGLGLQEAVQGSINLQTLGFSADKSKSILLQFGNAIASVGRGKEDLAEVIRQLGQLGARGQVTADNLKPIIERVPQVAKIIKDSFGAEALGNPAETFKKLGVSSEDLINTLITELSKLPRVTGGIKNDFENLKDSVTVALGQIGASIAPFISQAINVLVPAMEKIVSLFVGLPKPVQNAIIVFAGLASAMGPILLISGSLISAISSISAAVTAMGGILTSSLGVAALEGLAAAATVAAAAFAAWKLGEWAYSNIPGISALGDAIGGLILKIPGVEKLVNTLGGVGAVIKPAKDLEAQVRATEAALRAQGIAVEQGGLTLTQYASKLAELKKAHGDYAVVLDTSAEKAKAAAKANQALMNDLEAQEKILSELKKGYDLGVVSIGALEAQTEKVRQAFLRLHPEWAKSSETSAVLVRSLQAQYDALEQLTPAYKTHVQTIAEVLGITNEEIGIFARSYPILADEIVKESKDLTNAISKSFEKIGGISEIVKESQSEILKDMKDLSAAIERDDPFKKLGITSQSELRAIADRARDAYGRIKNDAKSTAIDVQRAWVKMIEAQIAAGENLPKETLRQYEKVKAATGDATRSVSSTWSTMAKQVSTIVTDMGRDISRSLIDVIKGTTSVGDAFKKMFESAGEALLRFVSEKLIGVLFKQLEHLGEKILPGIIDKLAGLFGIGGNSGGGVLGTSVGATGGLPKIPGLGGGPIGNADGGDGLPGITGSGTGGGTGSGTGIGSLTGLIGAIGSIGSFISGIVGNFQNARQEGTLNAIEQHTKVMSIALLGISAPWEKVAEGQDTLWNRIGDVRNVLNERLPWLTEFAHTSASSLKDFIQPNIAIMTASVRAIEQIIAAPQAQKAATQATTSNITINVNGAQDPAATAKAVMDLLKTQSPVFV